MLQRGCGLLQEDLPQLLAACPLPCIVTCRPAWEGCSIPPVA